MTYTPPEGVSIGTFTADTLPASFNAPARAMVSYKIYGTSEGAGVETETYGYKIPILCQSGKDVWNGTVTRWDAWNTSIVVTDNGDNSYTINYSGNYTYPAIQFVNVLEAGKSYKLGLKITGLTSALVSQNNILLGLRNRSTSSFVPGSSIRLTGDGNWETNVIAIETTNIYFCLMFSDAAVQFNNIVISDIVIEEVQQSNYDLFIGDSKLYEDEYVDYTTQKIYKLQEGELTPTDPPLPLPSIITYDGENTITSTETLGDVELTGEWTAIMGSTQAESIDIGFTVDADEYIAFATVDDGPSIQVSDTITMPSSADSFTLEVVSWGRERYTDTVYNALS